MNDEVRRLIYELVVEAKGQKEAADKTNAVNDAVTKLGEQAKKLVGTLGVAFTLKGIAQTLGDIQKIGAQLKTLGLSSTEAAQGMQDIENIAITTGSTIEEVSQVYQAAIEATQKLGGTQKDAAALADAFARSAKAQGKSAAEAAAQLDTLQFSLDRGTVKVKEFSNLLKENEIFQQAAEQATGKTTAQLIAMAQAGELTTADLAKMIEQFKIIGGNTEVPTTLEGITNSLIGMGKAFVDATAQTAGLNESLAHGNSGWIQFVNILRLVGALIGSILSIVFNLIETLGQAVIAINVAFVNAVTGNFKAAGDALDLFTQQAKENLDDVARSLAEGQKAFDAVLGQPTAPPPGRQLGDPAALAAQQAEADRVAREAMMDKGADKWFEEFEKQVEAANKERIEANQRRLLAEAKDNEDAREFERDQTTKLNDWLEAERVASAEAAHDQIEKDMNGPGGTSEMFSKAFDDIKETAQAGADVIGNAFMNAFSGATHNARDFFREILQGFAMLAAQAAFKKVLDALVGDGTTGFGGFVNELLGSAKGNVFDRGTLVPMASGGVVGGPTLFPMSGGRMGLMGEAGAEAVMPLRRGADGKLGVSGTMPRVEIHNNLGVQADARVEQNGDRMSIVLEAAQLGARMAESRVNRSLRTGYGGTAQSVQRTYGLRRRF